MKKIILLFAMLMLFCLPLNAGATLFSFWGEDAGGIGSAMMDINMSGNTLTATINNTSPTYLIDRPDDANYPGITGFGFNLDPAKLSLLDWDLKAFATTEDGAPLVTIGSSEDSSDYDWSMETVNFAGFKLDYMPNVGNTDGSLYNPDASPLDFGSNNVYYTEAILTMTFDQLPTLNTEDDFSPFVRMQSVGLLGEGSVKLPGTVVIPEPATLLLLGTSLAGLLGFGRGSGRKRKR